MGLVVLVTGFDGIGLVKLLTGKASLSEEIKTYDGFSPDWYMNLGNYVCLSVYMSAFLSSVFDIFECIIVKCKRWKDRGFKSNLKNDIDDEDDDEPNTK